MVAKALYGLPGVKLVEMKLRDSPDLLYVTYDASKVDPEKMIEAIQTVRFQAEIRKK